MTDAAAAAMLTEQTSEISMAIARLDYLAQHVLPTRSEAQWTGAAKNLYDARLHDLTVRLQAARGELVAARDKTNRALATIGSRVG